MPRNVQSLFAALTALAVGFFIVSRVLKSDPGANYFSTAQRFESNGQAGLAIRHYLVIADTQPASFYAPRALTRAADLTAAAARETNDKARFQQARDLYTRVADTYPQDPLAVEALMSAASLCSESLGDRKAARAIYDTILERFAEPGSDLAMTATLRVGQLALEDGDSKNALTLLQRVANAGNRFRAQPPEAQYLLGMVYETLVKDKAAARRAYELVLSKFPSSSWANDARERIGLMFFTASRGVVPPRRVMLTIDSLPDNGTPNGTLWSTLRCLLAARDLSPDEVSLRGWSLQPFLAGYDPANPGRVISSNLDEFDTVIANTGLRYTTLSGADESSALRNLQDSIDAGHSPLVYLQDGDRKRWTMAIGYDSDQNLVMLQDHGARYDLVSSRGFTGQWKVQSPLGKKFTLLDFDVPGQKAPKPSLTPAPTPVTGPQAIIDGAPKISWELPPLAVRTVHRRAVRRAGEVLAQSRQGDALTNSAALESLAATLSSLSTPPPTLPTPAPTPTPTAESPSPEEVSPYEPTPTPPPDPRLSAREVARARAALAFFGNPAREWSARRLEAAAYLDEAARSLGDPKLKSAAEALRTSANQLTTATSQAPTAADLGNALTPEARAAFKSMATALQAAREAERRVVGLLSAS